MSADPTSAASPAMIVFPALDNTMGALMIGALVSTALWGITCMQTFEYYGSYLKYDNIMFKIMVTIVFICDTLHEVFICHTVYTYMVSHFGDPVAIGKVEWSILAEVICSGLVAFVVQSFFTYRVWVLSRKKFLLVLPLALLVIAELAVTLAYFSKAVARVKVEVYTDSFKVRDLSQALNAIGAAGDILITVTLIYLLHRSKSGMRKSDAMVNSLILFALNTGLLTSLCALMSLIMILIYPDTFLYIAFFFCLSRLYANSLMATLNARRKLKNAVDGSYIATLDGDPSSRRLPTHNTTPSTTLGFSNPNVLSTSAKYQAHD
ncbi:hypothetical protein CYLTODRAFT_160531 [Cylindrobasidium torrendii FP15055 ss-10]|uniref:DUF6534 domain-containing protein n=1 Tax=Cylindrobasidium torrendii FP15055 ss-10 TaxID=1314674 RepID=A0A0D7BMS4_9AGAR|nr:hypothetical protein CYLTODRAFT_160531 [Cylindrobasidium torrendii FP15055 ss-10]